MSRRNRGLVKTNQSTVKVDATKVSKQLSNFSKNSASSYWMDFDYNRYYDALSGTYNMPSDNVFELAKYQRAIGNFVKIVSGKDIPVRFSSKDDSYTDGKVVTLTKNIKPANFDVVVGLACHEAAHVLLSDFKHIRQYVSYTSGQAIDMDWSNEEKLPWHAWNSNNQLAKCILNVVEDRRIDAYVRRVAPGYNTYYDALYDNYFNDKTINKALTENVWNTPTEEHYVNHLINFTNPLRNIDALPGLREIWDTLDIANIERIKTTEDAAIVAKQIYDIIKANATDAVEEQSQDDENGSGDDGNESDNNENSTGTDSPETNNAFEACDDVSDTTTAVLTAKEMQQIEKTLRKQREFVEDHARNDKKNLSQKIQDKVDAISVSEFSDTTKTFEVDGIKRSYGLKYFGKLTRQLVDSGMSSFAADNYWRCNDMKESVDEGFVLGAALARKLQLRNDDTSLQYNRQRTGKLDGRLIAEIGLGNYKIFERTLTATSKRADLYISVDASGSMSGSRLRNAVKAATAIAVAAHRVGNMRVRIDFRATSNSGSDVEILCAYDSKRDSIHQLKLMQFVQTGGSTPEGLAFEYILDRLTPSSATVDSYFINMSDGEPYAFGWYGGNPAQIHTRGVCDKIRAKGIHIMSYFISSCIEPHEGFNTMYGRDARYIETDRLVMLARTVNDMLAVKPALA